MIGTCIRRGLAAGAVAGLLAGLVGLVIGEPPIEQAVAIEEAAAGSEAVASSGPEVTRTQQRLGLPVGTILVGLGVGAVFGVAAAWSVGRLAGDAWQRSLKLGGVLVGALVLLPALKYPANPPAVGDPETVGTRTALYLGLGALGLVFAALGWLAARHLAGVGVRPAVRQSTVGAGLLAAVGIVLWVLPSIPAEGEVPAELLWTFRLRAMAVQATLYGVTAVGFGLLASREEQRRSR
ncbi:MAG: hypothetical protein GEV12_23560 [Micromonosporaceae bacterium]|nr:hypothetical protein [Micromonosporaceae bacterium]